MIGRNGLYVDVILVAVVKVEWIDGKGTAMNFGLSLFGDGT